MQKQKHKRTSKRINFLQIGIVAVLLAIAIGIILFLLAPSIGNSHFMQSTLPQELRPTAEALVDSGFAYSNIELADGTTLGLYNVSIVDSKVQTLCLAGYIPENSSYAEHTQMIVNGDAVSGSFQMEGSTMHFMPRDGYEVFTQCSEGYLDSGLHLIELQLRDSASDDPLITHQWAIEID